MAETEDNQALADQVFELKKEILAHEVERNLLKSNLNQLQGQLKRRVRGLSPVSRPSPAGASRNLAAPLWGDPPV